jgi:hypothetical protein
MRWRPRFGSSTPKHLALIFPPVTPPRLSPPRPAPGIRALQPLAPISIATPPTAPSPHTSIVIAIPATVTSLITPTVLPTAGVPVIVPSPAVAAFCDRQLFSVVVALSAGVAVRPEAAVPSLAIPTSTPTVLVVPPSLLPALLPPTSLPLLDLIDLFDVDGAAVDLALVHEEVALLGGLVVAVLDEGLALFAALGDLDRLDVAEVVEDLLEVGFFDVAGG